jgi:hypothetical protein
LQKDNEDDLAVEKLLTIVENMKLNSYTLRGSSRATDRYSNSGSSARFWGDWNKWLPRGLVGLIIVLLSVIALCVVYEIVKHPVEPTGPIYSPSDNGSFVNDTDG